MKQDMLYDERRLAKPEIIATLNASVAERRAGRGMSLGGTCVTPKAARSRIHVGAPLRLHLTVESINMFSQLREGKKQSRRELWRDLRGRH